MPEYRVTWEIDIVADSPEAAARQALEIMRDPKSTAVVFDVWSEYGDKAHVDLMDDCEEDKNSLETSNPPTQENAMDNESRRDRAWNALEGYDDDDESSIIDLLTDLRHLCHECKFDFDSMLTTSAVNFDAEK